MQDFMAKVNKVKIEAEIKNIKLASAFTEWSFKKVVKEVEECIEGDLTMKHKKIAGNLEKLLENQEKLAPFLQKHDIADS
jgi:nucleosome binding factor SPN SPT16 subunit